ncbi:pleckstrin homology domain-containing family B member 2 isoform X2 [Hemibagrus wyckioides]|uniref:pleckstrin homology domain-containing family B member 2 isoform X2 n=1 Tax=Hemibagrus wyckioides TaxID=337641 RepID=UPI00266D5DA5|nr:pleckstrin homology domain-containing family B member 2 isoform X2 [Hemibagrus wyckioides]
MAFVKSGWLHRQSTILRRWKKNWFDLWSDGRLIFYDDQQRRDMEDEIHMRVDCINIRNANACRDLTPPEGKGREALLQIVCRDGRVISLCADSADDAVAWTVALQDARINTVVAPPQFGFTQDIIASAPPSYAELNPTPQIYYPDQYGPNAVYSAGVSPAHEVNHVIIEERQRDDAGGIALGMLTGAATGLAIGSLFSVF